MEFREQLRKHYASVRRNEGKVHPKPSPDQFPMNIRYLVEKIELEELAAHKRTSAQAAPKPATQGAP